MGKSGSNPWPITLREETTSRKEDRARSYKGVVINGELGLHENDRVQRGYHGKGKGKMFEENDIKWVRVPDRGSKRSSPHCITNRGEEGNSRHRSSRSEGSRSNSHEDRGRHYTRRERSPLRYVREDVFEKGEIKSNLKSTQYTAREEEEKMIKVASPAKEGQLAPVNASDAVISLKLP
ncbi:hypothetical protein F2Q69_00042438 [Brassica cretica]|uniref:Uncharacterized protein n=2 Tax=Brassica cretica TaxID=69181 RepID=A0A8S9NCR2_BRACR|nr:hypothetical protein F2Q69_00042438 [Brassica cretica]